MQRKDLWKYCTTRQYLEMLLSFQLLGEQWTDDKVISCLYAVSNHVERHYREVFIPKKNGSLRRLLVPDPLLKNIQRNILHHILDNMRISPYAMAYKKGHGIFRNAEPHVGKQKVLKLDLEDFFGNIFFGMVLQSAFSGRYFPPQIGVLLTHLCCYEECLPQGSPASAAISNLVMRPFDDYMGGWCEALNISYTRYCDDMTFSGDFDEREVRRKVSSYLQTMGFTLNHEKTRLLTASNRQSVTGIVVNVKPQASREYRRGLKRDIYYCAKYGVSSHLMRRNHKEDLSLDQQGEEKYLLSLLGKINFVLEVNPEDIQFKKEKKKVIAMLKRKKEDV